MEQRVRREPGPRATDRSRSRGRANPSPQSPTASSLPRDTDSSQGGSRPLCDRAPGPEICKIVTPIKEQRARRETGPRATDRSRSRVRVVPSPQSLTATFVPRIIEPLQSESRETSDQAPEPCKPQCKTVTQGAQLSSRYTGTEVPETASPRLSRPRTLSPTPTHSISGTQEDPTDAYNPEALLAFLNSDQRPPQPVSLRAGYKSDALFIAHTLRAHATTPGLAKVMCEYLKQTHQCLHRNSELPLKTTASGADHDALLNTKRGQHSLRRPPPPNSDEEDVGVTSKRLCSTNSPPPSQSQPASFSQRDPRRHRVPETPATDASTPATTPAPADVEMPDAPNYASVTAAPTVPTLPTMGAKAPPRPKFPPLVVETLPNWTHHFKILKEKLGRAPNARPYGRGCRFTPDEEGEYRVIQKYLTELEAHENIS
ncbi:unnamed protein product [Pieris brassicae]|uniref:Uncharacterized protein n=1 Tax=Pieris brassicae TaxID=7116 RepID=A0A9P0SQ64_PIEBR|nr:unnamed protein product [Pieris brassicae]